MTPHKLRWLPTGMIGMSAMLSYLDRLLLSAAAPALMAEFHLNNEQYGQLAAVFSIPYALGAPFAGLFIDRLGLRVGVQAGHGVAQLLQEGLGLRVQVRAPRRRGRWRRMRVCARVRRAAARPRRHGVSGPHGPRSVEPGHRVLPRARREAAGRVDDPPRDGRRAPGACAGVARAQRRRARTSMARAATASAAMSSPASCRRASSSRSASSPRRSRAR